LRQKEEVKTDGHQQRREAAGKSGRQQITLILPVEMDDAGSTAEKFELGERGGADSGKRGT